MLETHNHQLSAEELDAEAASRMDDRQKELSLEREANYSQGLEDGEKIGRVKRILGEMLDGIEAREEDRDYLINAIDEVAKLAIVNDPNPRVHGSGRVDLLEFSQYDERDGYCSDENDYERLLALTKDLLGVHPRMPSIHVSGSPGSETRRFFTMFSDLILEVKTNYDLHSEPHRDIPIPGSFHIERSEIFAKLKRPELIPSPQPLGPIDS